MIRLRAWPWMAILWAVLLQASGASAAGRDAQEAFAFKASPGAGPLLLRLSFGPQQKWAIPDAAIKSLQDCGETSRQPVLHCVREVMRRHGGSENAFEFYRLTGWFLQEFKAASGPVRLARLAIPWRANENEQPALLGGSPLVVYPETAVLRDVVEQQEGFKALRARFPQLMLWQAGPEFEREEPTKDGQHFIFRYRLLLSGARRDLPR